MYLFLALKVPTVYGLHAEAVQAQFFCASLDALYDYQLTTSKVGENTTLGLPSISPCLQPSLG
jgi:hypothetical protein